MNEIKQNTDITQGPPDGVEAEIKCAITQISGDNEAHGLLLATCKLHIVNKKLIFSLKIAV